MDKLKPETLILRIRKSTFIITLIFVSLLFKQFSLQFVLESVVVDIVVAATFVRDADAGVLLSIEITPTSDADDGQVEDLSFQFARL